MARWFDGSRPTEHVVRIAAMPEGTPPPPPLDRDPFEPPAAVEARWAPAEHPSTARHHAPEPVGEPVPEFLWGSETPWWATLRTRLAFGTGASVVVLVVALVLHSLGGSPEAAEKELTASLGDPASSFDERQLADAAARAVSLAGTSGVTAEDLEAFLPLTCAAAESRTPSRIAGRLSMFRYERSVLVSVVRALRAGARSLCPLALDRFPSLFDELPSMVLTREGTSFSIGQSTTSNGLNGVANAPGGVTIDNSVTTSGSSTATVTPVDGSTSSQVSVDVVRAGNRCSVEGATASTPSGGTVTCTSSSVCSSSGAGLAWHVTSC
jgi:hypothetical protein